MSLRITVEDIEKGTSDTAVIADGDYMLVTSAPCYMAGVQAYKAGATHVITVKGRTATGFVSGKRPAA